MKRALSLLVVLTVAVMGVAVPAGTVSAGEAKQNLERELVGQWKVPGNKYKMKISFDFTNNRKFECAYTEKGQESVNWSGDWKVRTTTGGAAKAYLKARNQADPEKYMKAIIRTDPAMENFAIDITFNFKSNDKSSWQSKLVSASGGDDEEEGEDFDDEDDEDFDDEDDEDFDDDDFDDEEDDFEEDEDDEEEDE